MADQPKIPVNVEIDFEGVTRFDHNGRGRVQMTGPYLPHDLAEELKGNWVDWMECHKCGRFSYCRFVERFPDKPNRAREIQCGVAATALTEFVHRTVGLLVTASTEQKQAYLDGAYHFTKFVLTAETMIGNFLDPRHMNWMEQYVPAVFGQVVYCGTHLEQMGASLRNLERFRAVTSVLLVEGAAEVAFLKAVGRRGGHGVWGYEVLSYGGKDKMRAKRISELFDDHERRGRNVFIQGDRDGAEKGVVDYLVHPHNPGDRSLLDEDRVFCFSHDLESSWPLELLFLALRKVGFGENLPKTFDEFHSKMAPPTESVLDRLKTEYQIETDKVPLADAAGTLYDEMTGDRRTMFVQDSEVGRFLDWVYWGRHRSV